MKISTVKGNIIKDEFNSFPQNKNPNAFVQFFSGLFNRRG